MFYYKTHVLSLGKHEYRKHLSRVVRNQEIDSEVR